MPEGLHGAAAETLDELDDLFGAVSGAGANVRGARDGGGGNVVEGPEERAEERHGRDHVGEGE